MLYEGDSIVMMVSYISSTNLACFASVHTVPKTCKPQKMLFECAGEFFCTLPQNLATRFLHLTCRHLLTGVDAATV